MEESPLKKKRRPEEVKDLHDWIHVDRLHRQGVAIKEIARRMHMSKNTVKRLLKQREEPKYQRRTKRTKVDPYKEKIKNWYLEDGFIGTRIYEELQKIGYTGGINPVYRYLRELKEAKQAIPLKATVRFETQPADQAQFDWSPYKMVIGKEIKIVICFTLILAFSRMKAMVFSLLEDSDSIYEAIQELFEDLGGVTLEILIDNPKALVIEHPRKGEPRLNIDALHLATHLGTEFNPCIPARAQTKGKIEKPYQYIEEHFIKGNTFQNMTELNKSGKEFMEKCNGKLHGTTRRIPSLSWQEEQQYLLPLPKRRLMKSGLKARKVSLDSLVSIEGKKYSVPVEYVGKELQYRIVYGYKIELYDQFTQKIREYDLGNCTNAVTHIDEDYVPIMTKAPKSIPEVKRQFTAIFENGTDFWEAAGRQLQQPAYHAREVLKLRELCTEETLDKVLAYCMEHAIYEIDDIKNLLKTKYLEIVMDEDHTASQLIARRKTFARELSYYEMGGDQK
jgi:transposase